MAGESTYYYGYCTWYVAHELAWVRGGWGNAYQWAAAAARAGFRLTSTPTAGSVVVYGPGNGYSAWGHVAIVLAALAGGYFLVSEMDAVAWNVVSRRISGRGGVTAFILPPGVAAGQPVGPAINTQIAPIVAVATAWSRWTDARGRAVKDALAYTAYIAARLRAIV